MIRTGATMNLFLMTLISLNSLNAFAAIYEFDVPHTDIGFSVKHLMVSNTKGSFRDFKGSFDFDEAKGLVKDISVEIKVDSIDTRNSKRDSHLKSSDFFDSTKFPIITFKADSVSVKENTPVRLAGILTMRGVSKPIGLELIYTGKNSDPSGLVHVGFSLTTKINRKNYGISMSSVAVGEEVNIDISGEVIPTKPIKD
jgi:polyisoprenoid-binding protein YceI